MTPSVRTTWNETKLGVWQKQIVPEERKVQHAQVVWCSTRKVSRGSEAVGVGSRQADPCSGVAEGGWAIGEGKSDFPRAGVVFGGAARAFCEQGKFFAILIDNGCCSWRRALRWVGLS